jgi:hypothetical protein
LAPALMVLDGSHKFSFSLFTPIPPQATKQLGCRLLDGLVGQVGCRRASLSLWPTDNPF